MGDEAETRMATPPVSAWGSKVGRNAPRISDYSVHDKLQTSHRGQYSIERMLALHDYAQRVSTPRLLAVCVLTPVPALVVAVLLQLLAVKRYNPFDWADNTPFWILTSILSFAFAASVTVQAHTMLPTYPISLLAGAFISLATAAAMVLLLHAVARTWIFPVPFLFVLAMAPFLVVWCALFFLVVRRKPFPQDTTGTATALPPNRFLAFLVVQLVMIATFSAFEIFLLKIETHHLAQKICFLLYQTIRNVFKHTAACFLLRHAQDAVPELVVFSVELFVAWYMLFEMLVAYDANTLSAILGTVFLSALTAALHLNKRVKKLLALRHDAELPSDGAECLQTLVDALRRPHLLDETALSAMRLRASTRHALPSDLAAIVDNLQALPAFLPAPDGGAASANAAAVAPMPETSGDKDAAHAKASTAALHQTLVVLFNAEYLALVKYVEALAPLLYVAFAVVVCDASLANLWSFPSLAVLKLPALAATHDRAVLFSLAMAALPVLLLLATGRLFSRRRVGVSPLVQLAFVLETQQLQIQAKLTANLLFAAHFVMFQYGTDFHTAFVWRKFFP